MLMPTRKPPPGTEYSGGIWAPEIHVIDGRWYCYVACENPKEGNKSHRVRLHPSN